MNEDIKRYEDSKIEGYKGLYQDDKGFFTVIKNRKHYYEIGKEYSRKKISICEKGFHFCRKIKHIDDWYPIGFCAVAKVVGYGNLEEHTDYNILCSSKIKILKILEKEEVAEILKKEKGFKLIKNTNVDKTSKDISRSHYVYDSNNVFNSKFIESGRYIYRCNHIESSSGVSKSSNIYHSDFIHDCTHVKFSRYIRESGGISQSSYLIHCRHVNNSIFSAGCRYSDKMAFCFIKNYSESMLFNKEVDGYREIRDKIMNFVYHLDFIEINKHENYCLVLSKDFNKSVKELEKFLRKEYPNYFDEDIFDKIMTRFKGFQWLY